MIIKHATYGMIDTTGVKLTVESSYSAFTPVTGSIYGGTLLTITGKNFGTVSTDNPVELFKDGQKNVKCYVKETKATEIKCRVEDFSTAKIKTSGDKYKVIAFLKTFEEANCTAANCKLQFSDAIPEITSVKLNLFDATSNTW
jgi:hypothetical protein